MTGALKRIAEWCLGPPAKQPAEPETPRAVCYPEPEINLRIMRALEEEPILSLMMDINREFTLLTPQAKRDLLNRITLRFAHYVGDLPASERHHHARPFGLLEHSLDVSLRAVRSMSDPVEEIDGEEREQRKYCAFLLGLFHDVGKCIDIIVEDPAGGEPWIPTAESLASFLSHRNLPDSEHAVRHFVRGRGLRAHEWRGLLLWQRILNWDVYDILTVERLATLADAWVEKSFRESSPEVPRWAHRVVEVVSLSDQMSVRADLSGEGVAPATMPETGDPSAGAPIIPIVSTESGEEETSVESPRTVRGGRFDGAGLAEELLDLHGDLVARQRLIRDRMKELVQEYMNRVKRSRLVLFAKSRRKGKPVSALYWGIFMRTKREAGVNRRWIKHVSTPLNDTLIHVVARKHKYRHIFYDFDRRRLALNGALLQVNDVLYRMESSLTRRGKRVERGVGTFGGAIEEQVRELVGVLEKWQSRLKSISEMSCLNRFGSRPFLEKPESDSWGAPGEGRWHLATGDVIDARMSREFLKTLSIDRSGREAIMTIEVSRRRCRDAQRKAWKLVEEVRSGFRHAMPGSEKGLEEAARSEVDPYGQPVDCGPEEAFAGDQDGATMEVRWGDPFSGSDLKIPERSLEEDEFRQDVG